MKKQGGRSSCRIYWYMAVDDPEMHLPALIVISDATTLMPFREKKIPFRPIETDGSSVTSIVGKMYGFKALRSTSGSENTSCLFHKAHLMGSVERDIEQVSVRPSLLLGLSAINY